MECLNNHADQNQSQLEEEILSRALSKNLYNHFDVNKVEIYIMHLMNNKIILNGEVSVKTQPPRNLAIVLKRYELIVRKLLADIDLYPLLLLRYSEKIEFLKDHLYDAILQYQT